MKHWWKVLGIVPLVGVIYYACNTPGTKKGSSLEEKVEGKRDSSPEENQRTSPHQQKETPKYHPQEEARTEINKYLEQKKKNPLQKVQPTPKPSVPDYTLPEDDAPEEEYPPYYIPPEERDYKSVGELMKRFDEAIEARDYKIAETYIEDIIRPFGQQMRERYKEDFLCIVAADYDKYLSSIIENCKGHDAYSVLSKVIWMRSVLNENNVGFNICFATYIPFKYEIGIKTEINLDDLAMKGEKALQEVINCSKEP